MKVAQKLKEENIAEYLIYMWQVEDLIRANGCDIDRMCSNIVSRYPEEERAALKEWYGNLIEMMRAEGVTEKGHLQINRNTEPDRPACRPVVVYQISVLQRSLLQGVAFHRGVAPEKRKDRRTRTGNLFRSLVRRIAA